MTGYFPPSRSEALRVDRPWTRILKFGAPLASLSVLAWAGQALAQTTITSDTTAPLATSKAGDVTVNAGGTIKPASGVAVTVDSNNAVSNSGLIQFQDKSNVTGVQVLGGVTATVTNNATLEVDDTSTATTDSRGIVHGAFASGSGRFGIRLTGPGTVTGAVTSSSSGTGGAAGSASSSPRAPAKKTKKNNEKKRKKKRETPRAARA